MNRLYSTELTAVRADAKLFFDRPEDGSEIIGVITEIEPEKDELNVKMGLGDCEFHDMLLRTMGIEDVSVPLSGKMALFSSDNTRFFYRNSQKEEGAISKVHAI